MPFTSLANPITSIESLYFPHYLYPRHNSILSRIHLPSSKSLLPVIWKSPHTYILTFTNDPKQQVKCEPAQSHNQQKSLYQLESIDSISNKVTLKNVYSNMVLCVNSQYQIFTQEITGVSISIECHWLINHRNQYSQLQHAHTNQYLGVCNSSGSVNNIHPCLIALSDMFSVKQSSYWSILSQFLPHPNQLQSRYDQTFNSDNKYDSHFVSMQDLPHFPVDIDELNVSASKTIAESITTEEKDEASYCIYLQHNITKIALSDLAFSSKIINRLKLSYVYIRYLLRSHSFSQTDINQIIDDIKFVTHFYGLKQRRKLLRLFKQSSFTNYCSMNFLKKCSHFHLNKFRKARMKFKKLNVKLLEIFFPIFNLTKYQRHFWLNRPRPSIIKFFQRIGHLNMPSIGDIITASYFIIQYTNELSFYRVNFSKKYHDLQYFDMLFTRKFEELSQGVILSNRQDYQNILHYIYKSFSRKKFNNYCLKVLTDKMLSQSRCKNSFTSQCNTKSFTFNKKIVLTY